jgi:hypothetical protein
MALLSNAEHGLLFLEVSRSHSDAPQSVGLLCTSDQHDTQTSPPNNTQHSKQPTSMTPAVFEPATPANERTSTAVFLTKGYKLRLFNRRTFPSFALLTKGHTKQPSASVGSGGRGGIRYAKSGDLGGVLTIRGPTQHFGIYIYSLGYKGQHVSNRYRVIIRPNGTCLSVHETKVYVMGSHSVYIRVYWPGIHL